jgi:drug/metabolite transporter (DMT)-like permease
MSRQTADRAFLLRVIAAFAALYVIWGSTYFAIRVTLDSMSASASAASRFVIAGPLLLLLARLNGHSILPPRRELVSLGMIGCLLLVGGNGLVVWSEQYVASGLAALTVATTPLWIAIFGALLPRGERLPFTGWAGVLLGLLGLGVLLAPKLSSGATSEARGETALLLATLCWTCGSLYSKRVVLRVRPLVATGWEMLIAGVVLSLIAAATGGFSHFAPARQAWLALGYLAVFGSCIAFTSFGWLLQHVPAAKVMTYAYVNPVIAVFLGCVLRNEPFTTAMAVGTPIIVVAVALVTTAKVRTAQLPGREAPLQRTRTAA